MSVSMNTESVFLSAVQPHTSVSTYAVPSEIQLGHGGTLSDEAAKAKRVQQQVQMRLAEKFTSLPRVNGSSSHYAASEYGGTQTMKYSTYAPGFSSKSQMYNMSRTIAAPRMSQTGGYSSRSAVEMAPRQRVSLGGGLGGGAYQHDDMRAGGHQSSYQQVVTMSRADPETLSLRSLRLHNLPQQSSPVAAWMAQDGSEGSLSEREAAITRQHSYAASNGYTTQIRQSAAPSTMRRTLSGTLACAGGGGGSGGGKMEVVQHYQSFKGPAHRTISRIANRNNRASMISSVSSANTLQHQMSSGSSYGGGMAMGGMSSSSQVFLPRTLSVKSVHSVGKGVDVCDGQMIMGSTGNLSGFSHMDMPTAVSYLSMDDTELQVQGAAYIQHECYHNNDAKKQVYHLKGIPAMVQLFTSENQEVQRYATGAMRNIIYENMDNKAALIEAGGIPMLISALKEQDDELRKNITGILWNLSSKDSLKDKLAKETLADLTEKILIPLSDSGESETIQQSPSESEIFYNTTGCLRNLSSVNEKTRSLMRDMRGLVDSLVRYIQTSLQDGKVEDKGVENAVCVLRNLSYQLYEEMPPSILQRLEGPTRGQDSGMNDAIGCFTPKSKKAKDRQNQDLSTFTEVAKQPKGEEWLWHPQVVGLYNRVLQRCEINTTTREAAAGALQNITAGDKRWASVLSRVALEQERMLPVVMDLLRTHNDVELRSLTGFLRNLSRHAKDKGSMATKVVSSLVAKLPKDGHQKEPSSDVVINICGALNNLVIGSQLAARDITYFDGLTKLGAIKTSHDNSPAKQKAAKAASTVLCNMFQYKKLHKDYKQKGFTRQDFADPTI